MARQQRVGDRRQPDREDQNDRERPTWSRRASRRAAGCGRRAGPRATIGGTAAKSPLHEHDVGDAARHLRAAALRDREAGRLQRGHVVDAVADHRDVAAARRAAPRRRGACPRARCGRSRTRASAAWRSAAGVVRERLARRAAGRRRGCRRPRRSPPPSRAGRRRGPSARRPGRGRSARSRRRRRRSRSASTTSPWRLRPGRRALVGVAPSSGAGVDASASTRRPAPRLRGGASAEPAEREALRRAEHAACVPPSRAPLQR